MSLNTEHQLLAHCEGSILDEVCSGDSAHEVGESHLGVSGWSYSVVIKDLMGGSRKPHPRAAAACAESFC